MRAAAATAFGEPLSILDLPTPEIGPQDILVRIEACGVCATDLKVLDGALGADPERLPLIVGHEPVGVVEAVGAEVQEIAIGTRVAAHPLFNCGECDQCLAGEEEACPTGIPNMAGIGLPAGAYAEYMRMPADHAIPLPDGLSAVEAAPLLCAGLTVYAGLKNAGLQPGQRVAVLGIGGLGHMAIPIAKAMGAEVVAVTTSPDKAATARELGAVEVTGGAEAGEALLALGGVDIVLNTVDAAEPIMQVLPAMRPQSTLLLVTTSVGDLLPIPTPLMMGLQMRIVSSFYGSRQDLRELIDLAMEHNIRPITETFSLDQVNEAHDRLRANTLRYRAVLVP